MSDWEDFNKDLAIKMAQERAEEARLHASPHDPGGPPLPKTPINGVGFGLFLMTPFLPLLYLGLGLTLWAALGLTVLVGTILKVHLVLMVLVGLVLYVLAWIPGLKLERSLSQFKPYRLVRGTVRLVGPIAVIVAMAASNESSGPAMILAILAIVPFYLLCRLFDRLYFPVWSEVAQKAAMAQQGTADKRPLIKRVFYAVVWIIPFIALTQLAVLIGASMFAGGRDETLEAISPIRDYLGPGAVVLWLILAVWGKLPGTGRHRRSFVNYELQQEMRDARPD